MVPLAATLAAVSVAAEPPLVKEATVAELVGLRLEEVGDRLGIDHRQALTEPTFAMRVGDRLFVDGRLSGNWRSGDRYCVREGTRDGGFGDLTLTVVDGRVAAVGTPRRLAFDVRRRIGPVPPEYNPFTPAPGSLPGQDGPEAVLARFVADGLRADMRLRWSCAYSPWRAPPPPSRQSAGETVLEIPFAAAAYVVFAPYLATVPFQNARDRAARAAAPAVLAELQLGAELQGGVDGFARRWKRWTRLHRGEAGYVVGTVYLAGENRDRSVTFGVRDGVVEWVGRNALLDAGGLCVGSDGRFSADRAGCSRGGYYDPLP